MSELASATAVDALEISLTLTPVPTDQKVAGDSASGYLELAEYGATTIGIWEITPGTTTDIESDEIFIVLAGRATVQIEGVPTSMILRPGSVGRFDTGMRTRWVVTETLRKVYLT